MGKNKTIIIDNFSLNDSPEKKIEALKNLNGHTIERVLDDDSFLFISLTEKGLDGDIINSLYNKRTKKLKLLKNGGMLNDLDGGISFFPQKTLKDGEQLIDWKSAEEFRDEILSLDYDAQKAKYGERFDKVYQLANSLKEDDNPVLIIAKK